MLNNIKNDFFLRLLFSHQRENFKFELLKYNKALQNRFEIGLLDYKIFSGRYIVYEPEHKVKEYDSYSDKLLFEGKLINGKRNGEGIEYYENGKIKFIGEYLNGKRNGQGKEYYDNGEKKFKGVYLNGKRNGKGKEYYDNGKLKFEGEYLNGNKMKGKMHGRYYWDENFEFSGNGVTKDYGDNGVIKFEGEILNGERNGKGKEYDENGNLKFEGEYLNGEKI